jgi:hypothetical protein
MMGIKIDFPEQCELDRPVTMSISGVPRKFDDAVVFIASVGFEVEGERWRPASWMPVKFELVPRELGLQFIEVELFHGVVRIGYIVVETEVS